ncbi:hypothetical protein AAG570_006955 [Ranatra chinensis]|uniref:Protein croquemort n=1 Tax=Ranatra chinensis TaxID=642074 RepID=A0ABD0ZCG4_9HEMI
MVLRPGSNTYNIWKEPPVPIYMNFYLFNWTNPQELNTKMPKLVEMGPYCFKETDEKTNISWNQNGTVTFKRKRTWHFAPELSNGTLDDLVTTLNPVSLSAANSVRYWNYFMKKSLSMSMSTINQEVHVVRTVGELLFDGYTDPLLDIARKMPSIAGIDIPYDKFAWFYLRNESDIFEGVYNMDTGEDNIYKYGKLYNWNYSNNTSFYEGHCGSIKGTAGELFPPELKKSNSIEMFSADLCRSLALKFNEESIVRGINGYKYIGAEEVVDNGTLDSSNECYCDGQCVPSGVINVTSCRLGAPGFISFPHFLYGDAYYRNQVEGMNPDPDKHTLYLTLEPNTGIPLEVAARFQINLLLSPSDSISLYKNVPTIFFPMMWFEQRVTISETLSLMLKFALYTPVAGPILSVTLILIGLIILSAYIYMHIMHRR